MRLLPGFGPSTPRAPAAAPVPTRDNSGEERDAARRRQRQAEQRRAGRAATILSEEQSNEGLGANIARPQAGGARRASVLGG